MVDHN